MKLLIDMRSAGEMRDVAFSLWLTIVFFLIGIAYVRACDRLK